MTVQAPDRLWSGIDISKTLAGALAAVCAAVVGSYLGVAGTLIGAALASIVGSVGTEVYHRSIRKGTERLRPAFVTAPAAVGTPEVAAAESATPSEEPPRAAAPTGGRIRWARVAAIAGVLFVVALGTLTAVELMAGRSAASIVGGSSSGGTTVSSVTDGGDDKRKPAPVAPATPIGEPSAPPSEQPSSAPVTESPSPGEQSTTAPGQPAETETAPAPTGPGEDEAPPEDVVPPANTGGEDG